MKHILLATCSCLLIGGSTSAADDEGLLAWRRFDDAPERYKGTAYHWLGKVDLLLTIDVAPKNGHVIELLWGAKNDTRVATVTVNGRATTVTGGGYDGFRWQRVRIPAAVPGERYEVTITRAGGEPAFLAAVRLVANAARPALIPDPQARAKRVSLKTTPPSPLESFPKKRAYWDREPARPPTKDAREIAFRRAEKNARLANEQLYRCRRFVSGWLAQADPQTGLIPRNLGRDKDIWNAKDAAADNYPFMVLTAAITDGALFEGRMRDMLRKETELTSRIDRLPDTWSFSKQGYRDDQANLERSIFGGSEYVKDGLLPLTEWLGASPWSERMLGIVDDIWKHAPVKTPHGAIPSTNVEVNGEMLQALSRLYWMTGRKAYLDYAIRLGDFYLLGTHHPTRDFESLRLRDHGCEIVSGLCELYAMVHFAAPQKKRTYQEPIHAMCDRILEIGRDPRGMLYNTISPRKGTHHKGICDTWGYNYNGLYTVYLLDGKAAYRDAVRHALANLHAHLTDYHWGSADEYADSIEGAINLYNRERIPSAAKWIDSEIRDMWRVQRPDGVVEGWHGDGNSARTAIMYALWKTQGITVRPWREDVRFGAVRHGGEILISISADKPWAGALVFDRPRHKQNLRLPLDYPRINQFPEWFTVTAGTSYLVRYEGRSKERHRAGEQLQKGVPVAVRAGEEVRLSVQEIKTAPERRRTGAAVDVGEKLKALVEADWIERDRRFGGAVEFSLRHTRRVLEKAGALAARLRVAGANQERLQALVGGLGQLQTELDELEKSEAATLAARRDLYLSSRRQARAIAFSNPRLDLDRLLFIKRHDAGGVYHMCDQYYGCNAIAGGGIFVLDDPFGTRPRLIDVLRDAVVENGRLQGQKLTGSVLSPELSFDGETILFAHSEALAKKTYQWAPEFSYHIFSVRVDGSELRQLTDGPWNEFDPCFLPGGRVAFISERRGGYLRCGRHCPVYTLHSMNPDGSEIIRLSYHETHEWHPSVSNDGKIVYTRWDYVDRDTNVAHHIWSCFPDGRDPRSFHGNYPVRRESRPWMEMSIRAIPASNKFVATAAAHHGHAFGSLVLIDPAVTDDNAMSQLTRLTPEVPFPEAEGGKKNIRRYQAYGTPWPLSEDDYLVAYDVDAKRHAIYWIDRSGNRELIYGDRAIPCISPMPLRPRPRPPVIPDQTTQTAAAKKARAAAGESPRPPTIGVVNVYDSDFEWPPDTAITHLRVIQVLPKTTAPPNRPRIGVAQQTNARAVLGTVPVEVDGSAYFEAPSGKALYFQALDARGLAVQSMRSATYVHEGESLVCQGCHERKHRPPRLSARTADTPLAFRRPPSKITPDVDGSNPFSYVRLVQPVLDRNCVRCHKEEGAMDLSGAPAREHGWTRSYANLAGRYGFYFHVQNGSINAGVHGGSRTIAGKFGARAAPLLDYLDARHHGVSLSREDFHRLTLWLDCNSEFYGSYENTAAQSRGEVVLPTLD